MRWQGRKQSSNVEDRRRSGGSRKVGAGLGLGTIIVAIIVMLMGGNPMAVLQNATSSGSTSQEQVASASAEEEQLAAFVRVVLQDTEDVWNKLFREQYGREYREPVLVIYTGSVQSACGMGSAASGPFYCPGDEKLYIDLSFYQELARRFGAPGDFAMAYVVAHEVGHHIQKLQGITTQVDAQRGRVSKAKYNELSVRLELQADFLAGVWAHHAERMKSILEEGDIEEALRAANAIGDDNLQKQSQGYIIPESFTHGTSAQRMRWFKLGFDTGDLSKGNTFEAANL